MAQYQHRFTQKKKDKSLLLITLLIVAVLIIDWLTSGAVRNSVRTGFAGLTEGGRSIVRAVSDSGLFAAKTALARENATLRAQLTDLEARSAAYEILEAENEQLRAFARIASTTQGLAAQVISRRQGAPYYSFLVNAGTAQGVSAGDTVIASNGIVIGTVVEPGDTTSLVKDLFASGSTISVSVKDSASELEGRGSGNARGKMARASEVTVGDTVKGTNLAGRPVGKIGKVLVDQAGAYQEILVDQGVNFSTLEFVYIVTKP